MRAVPAVLAAFLLLTPTAALAQTENQTPPPAAAAPTAMPVYSYEIVRRLPHDPAAFTQGLVIRDGVLLESTGRSPSTVRRVRLEDGVVLQKRDLEPEFFGEGLTEKDGRVFSLSWINGVGFIWNADDLKPVSRFAYAGEGWGLTDNDDQLILSDGTPVIRFLDPETFEVTRQVTVTFRGQPVSRLNELEWVNGQILANIWLQDLIVRIDPETGNVVGVIDLTDLFPAAQRERPLMQLCS